MINKTLLGYLEYEARVKPHIKELVDRVDSMTDADIDAANTPLPWFKIALKMLRDSRLQVPEEKIEVDSDPLGSLIEWNAANDFIKDSGRMEIEVFTGSLLWRPDTGGVWFETVFLPNIDPKLFGARVVGRMKKGEYLARYKQRLAGLL